MGHATRVSVAGDCWKRCVRQPTGDLPNQNSSLPDPSATRTVIQPVERSQKLLLHIFAVIGRACKVARTPTVTEEPCFLHGIRHQGRHKTIYRKSAL